MMSTEWITTYPESIPSCIRDIQNHIPSERSHLEAIKTKVKEQNDQIEEFLLELLLWHLQALDLLSSETGLCSFYRRWHKESLRLLLAKDNVKREGEGHVITAPTTRQLPDLWEEWEQKKSQMEQGSESKSKNCVG